MYDSSIRVNILATGGWMNVMPLIADGYLLKKQEKIIKY
jgi:hypothetical protein